MSDEAARSLKPVKAGTLLMSFKLSIGKMAVAGRDLFTNEAIAALTILNSNSMSREYLQYFLSGYDWEAATAGDHKVKGKTLNKAKLKELIISFPPLPEQQRIVGILDQAFEGIAKAKANAEQNLANARSIFQTHLNDSFSESLRLSDPMTVDQICDVRGGKRVPKGYKFEAEPTDYRYATVTSFSMTGSINIDKTNYISSDVFDSLKRYEIKSGELYISIAGTIGRSGIFPENAGRCILTENACRMILKPNVDGKYIYLYMQSKHFMDQVAESTRTAAQPKLALERLKSILIPAEPIEKQIVMADSLFELMDTAAQLEDTYNRKTQALDELKSSILHQAFNGKL